MWDVQSFRQGPTRGAGEVDGRLQGAGGAGPGGVIPVQAGLLVGESLLQLRARDGQVHAGGRILHT